MAGLRSHKHPTLFTSQQKSEDQCRQPYVLVGWGSKLYCLLHVLILVFLTLGTTAQSTEKRDISVGFLVGVSGLGDQSFNDMTYAGLFRVKKEHEIELIFEDSVKSDEAFEASMLRLIQKGSNIIIANGFYMKQLVEKHAKKHPEIYFILQDAIITGYPNVISILYSVNEGSFLAGALAGMMTKTDHIGFIGGVDIPIMHVFRQGFREGVEYVNPKASISEQFISVAPDYSGFKQPAAGLKIALDLYSNQVDIIFSAAGLSGNGIIQAAKKTKNFAIGVDSDQDHLAKGYVLTSMMKRLDIATYNEVNKIIQGNITPGPKIYGLKQNGVGLSPMNFTKHLIPQDVVDNLKDIEQQIVSGKLAVSHYLEPAK